MPDVSFLHSLITGLVLALALAALHHLQQRRGARVVGRFSGEIVPSAALVMAACGIGLTIAAAAFWATFTQPDSFPVTVVGAGALVLSLATATALHPSWRIVWDAEGIEGPSTLLPRPGGPDRTAFAWDSLTAAGRDAVGNFFVQHWDGTRIRWNLSYRGHDLLMAAVERNCPHLFHNAQAET